MKIAIADIVISEGRQRAGIGGEGPKAKQQLEELAKSINRRLLHPIVLSDQNELIAGYRRVQAAKLLGWTEIEFRRESDLSDIEREELELDENIQRLDLTWYERAKAIARLHELRQRQDPLWGQRNTAAEARIDQHQVHDAVQLTKMVDIFPELRKAESMAQAKTWAKRIADQKLRTHEVTKVAPEAYADIAEQLLLGRAEELIRTIPDGYFKLILTDPPYGIEYDRKVSNTSIAVGNYDDSPTKYLSILDMAPELYRVLEPDGFLIWFCGFSWFDEIKRIFREAGFTVDEVPDVWIRNKGKCFTTNPDQLFPKGFDIAVHAYKGKPTVSKRRANNVFEYSPVESRTQSVERPVELYADFIEHLTLRGERVGDFFAGSGAVSAACEQLKRRWWACEVDPDRRARALTRIRAYRPDPTGEPVSVNE